MKKVFSLILVTGLIFIFSQSNAQCNSFAKKKCLPTLAPYTHNGQLNSTQLGIGESADISMTFYSGQDYRLVVCSEAILEGVYFLLKDANQKELYSSKDKTAQTFDFNVKTTQQMFIEVMVPESKKSNKGGNDLVDAGCVSILVGFKTH